MLTLTVKERVLLHLNDYIKDLGGYSHPVEVTQTGIASAIHRDRAVVAQVLKELIQEGKVTVIRGKVAGAKLAMKCYFLTQAGADDARKLEGLLHDISVECEERVLSGVEAQRYYIGKGVRKGIATISILAGEPIDIPSSQDGASITQEFFVGREREKDLLLHSKGVVIVLGIGGIGKTSLVRNAFASRDHIFLEWRDELSMKGLLSTLVHAISRSEGVVIDPSLERVCTLLRKRRLKHPVVLDNYGKSPNLDLLLKSIMDGGSTLIVTSREKPSFYTFEDVKCERVKEIYLHELTPDESKNLLTLFGCDSSRIDAIVENSCGYPLILRLAARSQLAIPRREVMELVHMIVSDLLTEGERSLLKRCSMITDILYPDILVNTGILSFYDIFELKKKCIFTREGDGYRMHEVLRELFHDESARMWAARYYAGVGTPEAAFKAIFHSTFGEATILAQMLEGYVSRLIERGYAADLVEILESAVNEGRLSGFPVAVRQRVEVAISQCEYVLGKGSALARLKGLNESEMDPRLRCDYLRILGLCISRFKEQWKTGVEILRNAINLGKQYALTDCVASAYVNILSILSEAGEGEEITTIFEEGKETLNRAGEWFMSRAEYNIGCYYTRTGKVSLAESYLERAIKSAERISDIRFIANAHITLGHLLIQKRMYSEAEKGLQAAIERLTKCGDVFGLACAKQNLGRALLRMGKTPQGVKEYEDAERLFEEMGATSSLFECRMDLIEDLIETGDQRSLTEASKLCREMQGAIATLDREEKTLLTSRMERLVSSINARKKVTTYGKNKNKKERGKE